MAESELHERIEKLRHPHKVNNPSTGAYLKALAIIDEQAARIDELEMQLQNALMRIGDE